jgi:hypothetical protein
MITTCRVEIVNDYSVDFVKLPAVIFVYICGKISCVLILAR